jgi:hypothetical protein
MCSGKTPDENNEASNCNVTLSSTQVEFLISLCSGLVSLCAEVTGRVDPSAGRLLEYVAEEICSKKRSIS